MSKSTLNDKVMGCIEIFVMNYIFAFVYVVEGRFSEGASHVSIKSWAAMWGL